MFVQKGCPPSLLGSYVNERYPYVGRLGKLAFLRSLLDFLSIIQSLSKPKETMLFAWSKREILADRVKVFADRKKDYVSEYSLGNELWEMISTRPEKYEKSYHELKP